MPDADPLVAELASIRSAATAFGFDQEAAWRLLAAVEAVLTLHHPEDRGRVLPCCAFCCTKDECVAWTECPEREAISRPLLPEGEDSA